MVRPLIGADLCEVGALVVGGINQQAANEDFRISPKVIFCCVSPRAALGAKRGGRLQIFDLDPIRTAARFIGPIDADHKNKIGGGFIGYRPW